MYKITKSVIESRNYELRDIIGKIDTLWLNGSLTETEREELISLARDRATPEMGYASVQAQIDGLKAEIEDVKTRLYAIEHPDAPDESVEDEYPIWHQPTGAHDAYYTGAKMTYTDGNRYVCTAPEGYGVTYGPDILPSMWTLAEE